MEFRRARATEPGQTRDVETDDRETPLGPDARPLHPRIRTVWWVSGVLSDLVVIGVATAVGVVVSINTDVSLAPGWLAVPAALVVASLLGRSWYVRAAYRAWRYRLGEEALDLAHGVFWRQTSSMPYHRLQQVDVGQGPLERWLGMATVQLRSAAATTDATLPGIALTEVDELRSRLLHRAGRDDGT